MNRRLSEHRREFPGKLNLILYEVYEHNDFLESCIHRYLYKTRKRNTNGYLIEIFESEIPIIIKLLEECKAISESPRIQAIVNGDDSVLSNDETTLSESNY